jgi:hypothetical protein
MKKIIIPLFLVLISFCSRAQQKTDWGMPYNDEKKAFMYEEVVTLENNAKSVMYRRALDWIAEYFKKQNKIVEKDSTLGMIKIKDRIQLYKMEKKQKVFDAVIEYHMDMQFKDGRYKYTLYKFRIFGDANSQPIETWMNANYTDPKDAILKYTDINRQITEMITSFKNFMKTGKTGPAADW